MYLSVCVHLIRHAAIPGMFLSHPSLHVCSPLADLLLLQLAIAVDQMTGWESPCAACVHPKRVGFPMSGKISLQISPIQTESSVTRSTSFKRALPFPTDQNDSE